MALKALKLEKAENVIVHESMHDNPEKAFLVALMIMVPFYTLIATIITVLRRF
jgi:hypothetical protein